MHQYFWAIVEQSQGTLSKRIREFWYLLPTAHSSKSNMWKSRNMGWKEILKKEFRASLMAQCLRIHLPMQRTWVWSLVREDPTCRGATKPVRHYWACTLEPASHSYWSPRTWSPCSTTRKATSVRSPRTATKSSPNSQQLEKSPRAATKTQRSQK